ncbi:DUF302 domain-containing protein [Rhodococcus triatomae]|uniref:Uncharacterized conserved protein, DUF302 family n=1 Tax=Rhodococcus triatomae TaxID=300028 RepID=A0A1G8L632_9NOCA|nr:DUF302 domain-containing protein [Rhodococcus triatomae]QNG20505.1 DUF302 domain-containing protein [Rhodococcus triatomae]QNG23577.1 DUF302 domain-containing protein [Rhodococcus triatomae]SDI50650.1 Uncharacterized conserved protein, DUF302 family [Rhodococcus triatomae]
MTDDTLALATRLHATFDEAVQRTRNALQEQGFGILTEIDMSATLKSKIDVDMERYVILGACNPPLAHRAVDIDRRIGLLLPCNVVVREDRDSATEGGAVVVEAMNPQLMVQVTGEPALAPVAAEAGVRLRAAIDSLAD